MRKYIVAIVGRPNVGKSTLFNRIIRKRSAVIEDFPGITRDRIYGEAEWEGKHFLVVDTGGFQRGTEGEFASEITIQVMLAVEEADFIVVLLDAGSGILPQDLELINKLRALNKKIFYAVNKVDSAKKEQAVYDFYSLGVDLFPVSSLNGYGYEALMDSIAALLPDAGAEEPKYPRIAIVGRPNVGKSTLVNALLSRERMIVSPIPGTTRDAVDSECAYYGKKYTIIDTAGIRKKGRMAATVERYSFLRTLRNIEECDVAILVIDASEGVVELDQRIAGLISSARKGCLILLNKWDLVDKDEQGLADFEKEIQQKLWFVSYAPVLTVSAETRKRVTKLFSMVDRVMAESSRRIGTHELNMFLEKSTSMHEPPLYKGKKVKIQYITQVRTSPPGFLIFTNRKEGIKEQYLKFLEKRLREKYTFEGVPIQFFVRQKKK